MFARYRGQRRRTSALTLTYLGSNPLITNLTTYNHGSFVAPSNGLMIVAAAARGPLNVTSISVGGTNGNIAARPTTGSVFGTGIVTREVAAGSQAVSVTWNAAATQSAVFVWFLTGYASATPHGSVSINTATNATGYNAALNVPAGGVAIFAGICEQTANNVTFSAATSRGQTAQESHRVFGADYTATVVETPHSETIGWASSVDYGVIAASWV